MTISGLSELKGLATLFDLRLGSAVLLYVHSTSGVLTIDYTFQTEFDELLEKGFVDSFCILTDKAYELLSLVSAPEVRMFNEFIQLIPTSDKFDAWPRTTALRSRYSKTLLKDLYQRVIKHGMPEDLILQKFAAEVGHLKDSSYLCNNLTKWSPYKTLEDMLKTKKHDGVINRSSQDIL